MSSPLPGTDLVARSRSLAEELEQLGTLFGLTTRPSQMVQEVIWASQTLHTLADHMNENNYYPKFAQVVIHTVTRTRLNAWRTAAQLIQQQARKK